MRPRSVVCGVAEANDRISLHQPERELRAFPDLMPDAPLGFGRK